MPARTEDRSERTVGIGGPQYARGGAIYAQLPGLSRPAAGRAVRRFRSGIFTHLANALSRRRSTEEGIPRASRYLATVRRATLMPSRRSMPTI